MHGPEKSDSVVVAGKPTNKAERSVAEPVEPRTGTKGNADQQSTRRAQDRVSVSQALERVRQAARQKKKERFTALLHHVAPAMLRTAFYALKRDAGRGITLHCVKCRSQHGGVDVVQKRGEPLLLPLPCGLPYAVQRL